jgi:hypothetical protein
MNTTEKSELVANFASSINSLFNTKDTGCVSIADVATKIADLCNLQTLRHKYVARQDNHTEIIVHVYE